MNCSYWTILCFTLLNNRRYQRERRSVTRCNECLVVSVLVFERIGESTGNVFAGDLTPLPELLGRLYGARAIILGQAARTDDGVVEATALQTFAGAASVSAWIGPEDEDRRRVELFLPAHLPQPARVYQTGGRRWCRGRSTLRSFPCKSL